MPTPAAKSEDLIFPGYHSLTLTALTTKTFAKSARPLKSIYRPLDPNNKARMESTGGLTNNADRYDWLGFFPLAVAFSRSCLKPSILLTIRRPASGDAFWNDLAHFGEYLSSLHGIYKPLVDRIWIS